MRDVASWGLLPPPLQQQQLPTTNCLNCLVMTALDLPTDSESCCGPAAVQQTSRALA